MPLLQLSFGRMCPSELPSRLAILLGEALEIPPDRVMVVANEALVHLEESRSPAVLADLCFARELEPERKRRLVSDLVAELASALSTQPERIYVRIMNPDPTSLWRIDQGQALHAEEKSTGSKQEPS